MSGGKGWWSSPGSSMFGASSTDSKGITERIGQTASGIGNQFKSMGSAVTSAFGKTKNSVVGAFTQKEGEVSKDDPTSLLNIPKAINPEVYVANGQMYEAKGDHAKALENYNKALEAEPRNVPAMVSTARLYERQGQADRAAEYFRKALDVNPNDASIHNDLGLAYQKAGNAAAARESLAKATSLDPNNVRYKNNLATLLVEGGQTEDALAQLKTVFPPAVAHYNVAYMQFTKQNIPAAQQQLQLALQADPNMKEARDLYAKIGGSQFAQQAAGAYQMAGNIYQTFQGQGLPGAAQQAPAAQLPATQYPPTQLPAGGVGSLSSVPVGQLPSGVPTGYQNAPVQSAGSLPGSAQMTGAQPVSGSQPNWMSAPALPGAYPIQR